MGDEVVDLPVLRRCGFACAPREAHELVRAQRALRDARRRRAPARRAKSANSCCGRRAGWRPPSPATSREAEAA